MSKLQQHLVYRRHSETSGANPFNPTPGQGNLPRTQVADAAPVAPVAPQLPPPAAPVQAEGIRFALIQGTDTLASTTASHARKTPESSLNAGMYGKIVAVVGQPLTLQIGGSLISGNFRQFNGKDGQPGNFGWYFNAGKMFLAGENCQCGGSVVVSNSKLTGRPAEGSKVVCQVSINATVIHSKAQ